MTAVPPTKIVSAGSEMGWSSMLMLELLLSPMSGSTEAAEAARTPGRALILVTVSSKNASCSASDGYCSLGSETRMVRRFAVSNPGSTAFRAMRLRIIRPALIMSASARATWPTTRRSRRTRSLRLPNTERLLARPSSLTCERNARRATGKPNPMLVTPSSSSVKPRARPLTATSPTGPTDARSPAARMSTPQKATATPSSPPPTASSADSVSIWRTSRPGPAPSAVRTANSRSRLPRSRAGGWRC